MSTAWPHILRDSCLVVTGRDSFEDAPPRAFNNDSVLESCAKPRHTLLSVTPSRRYVAAEGPTMCALVRRAQFRRLELPPLLFLTLSRKYR